MRPRGWLEVRWRQARNPPPPIIRAVVADLVVAIVGAVLLLAYDVALARGLQLPGGDLRTLGFAVFIVVVVVVGSVLTYLWVPLPRPGTSAPGRSGWSAMLGFFAAWPIAYLVLVVAFQVIRPFLGP
ncbi:MAG TPA: hypothetical protein VFW92_07980 [Candidatus Limnocylindrales bacterium]|nr:hypothetical protein [Candidatus Limnocylindrales bacterium]